MKTLQQCLAAALLLALAATPALGQTAANVVAPPAGTDLADTLENYLSGTNDGGIRIRLQGNANYVVSRNVILDPDKSPFIIEGPGGEDNLPNNTIISIVNPSATNAALDVFEGSTLTLKDVGIRGAGPNAAIQVATNAVLNMGRCYVTQGNTPIRVFDGGTINAASSVFNSCNGAIQQGGGTVNLVQCTFLETAPGSIFITRGTTAIIACLFATPGDAPVFTGSVSNFTGKWHGNIINIAAPDTAAPSSFNDSTSNAPAPVGAINFSTDANAWPGKLDEGNTAFLASGVNVSTPSISPVIQAVSDLRLTDFEGDGRGTGLQVGADEQGAAQLAGWIAGTIIVAGPGGLPVVNDINMAVAGKDETVTIRVETRGINLATAVLRIVPQLGDETNADEYEEFPITEEAEGLGTVVYTSPSDAYNEDNLVTDGRATIYIVDDNLNVFNGLDNNLDLIEYQFIIDTTPPTLGVNADGIAYERLNLSNVVSSNDRALGASSIGNGLSGTLSNAFPGNWGPNLVGGENPSNTSTFGLNQAYRPQVYFNGPVIDPLGPLATPLSFSLPLQFYDEPAKFFGTTTPAPVETSGFVDVTDLTSITQAYAAPTRGDAFLGGSVPSLLSGPLVTFNQLSTAAGDRLDVLWSFGNLEYAAGGWQLVLNPGAADLAGNLYNEDTGYHPDLEFWWLANTDLIAANISLTGPGDPETPSFSWSINRSPSPNEEESPPCVPLVSYRLWRADNPADPFTGYTAVSAWSGYSDVNSIEGTTIFPDPGSANLEGEPLASVLQRLLVQGASLMLTIMVADEAGNLQESLIQALGSALVPQSFEAVYADVIPNIAAFQAEQAIPFVTWNNVSDLGSEVDTRLRAKLFWNRVGTNPVGNNLNIEGSIRRVETAIPGERDFGSSTRIPLPPLDTCGSQYSRVEAQFFLTAQGENPNDTERNIEWQFMQEGKIVSQGIMTVFQETGFTGVLQIPEDIIRGTVQDSVAFNEYGYPFIVESIPPTGARPFQTSSCPQALVGDRLGDEGDPEDNKRRRNLRYLIRAATQITDIDTGNVFVDNTPATFQFTVTPGDEFDGVGAGEQPVKIQTQR